MPNNQPVYKCPECDFSFNQNNIEDVMRAGQCPGCKKTIGKDAKSAKETAADIHFQILTVLVRNFYLFGPIGLAILFIVAGFLIVKPFIKEQNSILDFIVVAAPGIIGAFIGHFLSKKVIRAWAIKKNAILRDKYKIRQVRYKYYRILY